MTDDLVKRLRQWGKWVLEDRPGSLVTLVTDEAADRIEEQDKRIEQLEAALHEWDALICHQYSGSREAMSDMTYAAQNTARLLYGDGRWPHTKLKQATDRIEQLEAALRLYMDMMAANKIDIPHTYEVARAALAGEKKDD